MSSASNLGYENTVPLSNVNGEFVNKDNSHNPATFGSNEVPSINTPISKFLLKGGAKKLKRKIKNITKKYKKMKAGSRKLKSLKHRVKKMASRRLSRSMMLAGSKKTKTDKTHKRRRNRQRGGYSQYQNNQPFSLSYSVGGVLPASQLSLANPPPITVTNHAVDNYNHYTNTGFASRGH